MRPSDDAAAAGIELVPPYPLTDLGISKKTGGAFSAPLETHGFYAEWVRNQGHNVSVEKPMLDAVCLGQLESSIVCLAPAISYLLMSTRHLSSR
jgi:hypothetical protein